MKGYVVTGYVIRAIDKKGTPWFWTGAPKEVWTQDLSSARIYKEECRAEITRAKQYEKDCTYIWEKAQVVEVNVREKE